MCYQFKIAEIDLSVFTGTNTQLLMTAEEAEHGYDYHVTAYTEGTDDVSVVKKQTWSFYDQPTADKAVEHLKKRMLEFLG